VTNRLRFVRTGLLAVVMTLGVVVLQGQTPPAQTPPPAQAQAPQAPSVSPDGTPRVTLTVGRSKILSTEFDITRVAITNPAVADVTVIDSRELLLDGKGPGTISLIIWGDATRSQYDVVVDPGVSGLQRQIQTLFPGEDITAIETPEAVVLSGRASNNAVMLRVGELAEAMVPKAKIINLLQIPGGNGSQQVLLQVRIAEVNRRAMTELGVSIFTGSQGANGVVGRTTTGQFPSTTQTGVGGNAQTVLSDLLNIFLFSTSLDIGVVIKALESKGMLQSLAEPNLVAYNNQEASFLAGGELPVPMVQGNSGQVTIEYKEFGVRLWFKPTIAGDVIRLKVKPEVSSLDFANGVSVAGFRVPALSTRRAETDVELRDGQSFAIGGLLNNIAQDTNSGVPFLSSLPIIGYLFKSKATSQERTELMVLVTPHLVRPLNPDEVPALPTIPEKFLPICPKPPCDAAPVKKGSGG
jgi:pilus assembly protein CpaC